MARELSQAANQELVDKYVAMLVETTDRMLADFGLEYLEEAVKKMNADLRQAEAVAGIMVPLDAVDIRGAEIAFFRSIVKMAKAREEQREVTAKARRGQAAGEGMRRMFGL